MKYCVAMLLLESAAVTVTLPVRPVGTAKYPMNAPPAAVSGAGVVVTICPPTCRTIEPAVNPLPRICMVLPTAASDLSNVIVGNVRVNVALAVFPAESVITSVFVAVAVIGTTNVGVIPPVPVMAVELRVIACPLNVAETVAGVAAKPVPVTAIVVPLMAVVGAIAIVGCTVIAVWTDRPVFASCKVSKYVPAKMPVGTMNHVVFVNAFSPVDGTVYPPNWLTPATVVTVVVPATVATRVVLLNDASVILLNPVTVMVTLLPDTAVVGAVSVGAPSTVIVASAVSVPTVTRSVYVPATALAGTVNFTVPNVPNDPVEPTEKPGAVTIAAAVNVDPL